MVGETVQQRAGHLTLTMALFANLILDDSFLAYEAMFVAKTLEDPLRRVPLLIVNRAVF